MVLSELCIVSVSYPIIPQGSLAAYYPETNPLVALGSHDKYAKIPASKSIPVILHAGQAPEHFNLAVEVDPEHANQRVSGV